MRLTQRTRDWRARSARLAHILDRLQPSEQTVLVVYAGVVGLLSGLGILLFRWLIGVLGTIFLGAGGEAAAGGPVRVLLGPAVGGLAVGLLIHYVLHGERGHGVASLMETVALGRAKLAPGPAAVRVFGASITLGSGGSAGPEDPSVQIGAAVGSVVGQLFHLSHERVRTLLAAGAAGGIASAFNAPIAGVFFAMEIVLGDFSTAAFGVVVLSSVVSALVTQALVGSKPAFPIPAYTLLSPVELAFYLVLGMLAAVVSVAYIQAMHRTGDLFARWSISDVVKPAIGGLVVGVIGLAFPQVMGVGYGAIGGVLEGQSTAMWVLAALVVAKMVATAVTLGSGGLGGMFAPSLFLGAMLGGAFGQVVDALYPGTAAPPSAYALVGMAAVLAGTVRAPITAIILLFEMTNDYRIILPLMFATVVCLLVAEQLQRESIYTLQLSKRGVRLERGRDIDVMQAVTVGEVMTRAVDTVPYDLPLADLTAEFARSHHHGFPVLDANGELYGIVSIGDVQRATGRPDAAELTAADVCTTEVVTVTPGEPMWAALKKMAPRDLSRLPVVAGDNPRRPVGLIRRADLVKAYNVGIMRRADLQQNLARMRVSPMAGAEFVEIEIGRHSHAAGRSVGEVALPCDCVLVSIRRGPEVLLPHGTTVIQPQDRVVAIVRGVDADALREALQGE